MNKEPINILIGAAHDASLEDIDLMTCNKDTFAIQFDHISELTYKRNF